jgi:GR25 family glycosyltransferase involved in LPS biosynthesis
MRIYWINIGNDANAHRRLHMQSSLDSTAQDHVRIEAVTPSTLKSHRESLYATSPSEYCCTASHLLAMRTALDAGVDECMIAEDDAMLSPEFLNNLPVLIEGAPDNWDVLQICSNNISQAIRLFNTCYLKDGSMWDKWVQSNWGTGAYIIRAKAMQTLLNVYETLDFSRFPNKPVSALVVYEKCNTYTITYPFVRCLDIDSNIHPDHVESAHAKYSAYSDLIRKAYPYVTLV